MVGEVAALPDLTLQLGNSGRIGIDGTDGVRKTTISAALSKDLRLPLISLDDYLVKNQGGFIEFLRYDELRYRFKSLARFIVEGVCLLEVLERVGVAIDTLVYVKRFHLGFWADERELDVAPEGLEEFLAKERELVETVSRVSGGSSSSDDSVPGLAEEIVRYHSRYRPHENADYVYRWNDG